MQNLSATADKLCDPRDEHIYVHGIYRYTVSYTSSARRDFSASAGIRRDLYVNRFLIWRACDGQARVCRERTVFIFPRERSSTWRVRNDNGYYTAAFSGRFVFYLLVWENEVNRSEHTVLQVRLMFRRRFLISNRHYAKILRETERVSSIRSLSRRLCLLFFKYINIYV